MAFSQAVHPTEDICQTNRRDFPWAQLLKRTFKIDVLGFSEGGDKFGGRMKLEGVVFDQPTISITLRALGLPVRAPSLTPKQL